MLDCKKTKIQRFSLTPENSHCALFTLRPLALLCAPHLDREIFTLFPTFPVPEFRQGRISHFTLAMALLLPLSCFFRIIFQAPFLLFPSLICLQDLDNWNMLTIICYYTHQHYYMSGLAPLIPIAIVFQKIDGLTEVLLMLTNKRVVISGLFDFLSINNIP